MIFLFIVIGTPDDLRKEDTHDDKTSATTLTFFSFSLFFSGKIELKQQVVLRRHGEGMRLLLYTIVYKTDSEFLFTAHSLVILLKKRILVVCRVPNPITFFITTKIRAQFVSCRLYYLM